jgi:hypothetical protein
MAKYAVVMLALFVSSAQAASPDEMYTDSQLALMCKTYVQRAFCYPCAQSPKCTKELRRLEKIK